jgi:hypothetical protein
MSRKDAWKERKARREAGDPTTRNDFAFQKLKTNHVDEFGYRYQFPSSNVEVGDTITVGFNMPTAEQTRLKCDGCTRRHSEENSKCCGSGGHAILISGHEFKNPTEGQTIKIFPLKRNNHRKGHAVYISRVEKFQALPGRRTGQAKLRISGIGLRTYKR